MSPAHQPATPAKKAQKITPKKKQATSGGGDNKTQHVLLGVGLAFAILALIAVIGIGIYSVMRPDNMAKPAVKTLEDGKVVIIRE